MDLKEAREIAKYVVPRFLADLPKEIKEKITKPEENEDALLFRLTEKTASDIQYIATLEENKERDKYL